MTDYTEYEEELHKEIAELRERLFKSREARYQLVDEVTELTKSVEILQEEITRLLS